MVLPKAGLCARSCSLLPLFDIMPEIMKLGVYFLHAGVSELGMSVFRAKVGMSNTASFHLFKDKLSFKEVS